MPYVPYDKLRPWKGGAIRPPRKRDLLPWVGMDTETCRGDIMLMCDSDGEFVAEPDIDSALEFMYRPDHRVAWYNIRYDIECVLKLLPHDVLEVLIADGRAVYQGPYCKWRLFWIPKKTFTLRPANLKASRHYDTYQFFDTSLEKALNHHLGGDKYLDGLDKEDVVLLGDDIEYWQAPGILQDAYNYCVNDAAATRDLMQLWQEWALSLSLDFTAPISPASLSATYAIEKGHPARPNPGPLTEAAYAAYIGGWFEVRGKGTFPKLWKADIVSAYPSVIKDLPNSDVMWQVAKSPNDYDSAHWGFVLCDVNVTRRDWSPILKRYGVQVRPIFGKAKNVWLTLWEYNAYRHDFDIAIKKGYVAEDTGERPFAWIEDIFNERRRRKDAGDPTQYVLKVLMNSLYGKWLQKVLAKYRETEVALNAYTDMEWKVGTIFNPILAAHTTAATRIKIWQDIVRETPSVEIMTDGVLTTEPPNVPTSKSLGGWEVEGPREGTIVGNGLYILDGERGKGRGIQDARLRGVDWTELLSTTTDGRTLRFDVTRPIHPAEALRQGQWGLTDIGRFVEFEKRLDLLKDDIRTFPGLHDIRQLLTDNFTGHPKEILHE